MNIVLNELEFIWNYSPGQPRDKKGRWTYEIGGISSITTRGNMSLGTLKNTTQRLQKYKNSGKGQRKQYYKEYHGMMDYQGSSTWINDCLRTGDSLKEAEAVGLDEACRFSSSKPFRAYRGESSFSNRWKGVKVGDKMPKNLHNSFISTSTNRNSAVSWSHEKREISPTGTKRVYETVVAFKVPTKQRFGIPAAYTRKRVKENEILLPYKTDGTVTGYKESKIKTANGIEVIKQSIEITIK